MLEFSDEELLAYADERLASVKCVAIEQSLRDDAMLSQRLSLLLANRDQGSHSVGELWRRHRLSCPHRAVWAAFVDGRLGDGMSQYLRFHVEVVGCRVCAANLADLEQAEVATDSERRTRKIFQSSAGTLHPLDELPAVD
jgi:hypothetical protein